MRWSQCALTVMMVVISAAASVTATAQETRRPNIVLVMADDQGWGQTGYQGHPVLKTPNLDAMAAVGLRFNRFYANAPVCSPTRAGVLTGRTNRRTGVESHGFALRRQEKTLPQALKTAGYATGHFGKWHLNGLRGPGVPVLATDRHSPGVFGFDTWLSVTNFFDLDPILSRNGEFEEFTGDSSEIVVAEAVQFIREQASANRPSFTVIWFGTPHSPFRALPDDAAAFEGMDANSAQQHGELVAMDRSIGTLRSSLRDSGIADNTILWFCSDNGGLPKISPDTTGGLRGFKGSLYEGGIRVPGIIEWPSVITSPRQTEFPAFTCDIFPTLAEITGLPEKSMVNPTDGISLVPLFDGPDTKRESPMPFSCLGSDAVIDNQWKLIRHEKSGRTELFDLSSDPLETRNLMTSQPDQAARMTQLLTDFRRSLQRSIDGLDYPEGRVDPDHPEPGFWTEAEEYRPYFSDWKDRPEYRSRLRNLNP